MAERRMLSNTVLNMGKFIALPLEAQLLYLRLNLIADDEGFLDSPMLACRVSGTGEAQVRALTEAGFLICFPEGPLVITHWHVHNKLRKDRKKETLYQEYLQHLTLDAGGVYRLDEPETVPVATVEAEVTEEVVQEPVTDRDPVAMYNAMCPSLVPCDRLTAEERRQAAQLEPQYLERLFQKAEQTPFLHGGGQRGWRASLPWLLKPGNGEKLLSGRMDERKKEVPKGATGRLGEAELEAIRRALAEPD